MERQNFEILKAWMFRSAAALAIVTALIALAGCVAAIPAAIVYYEDLKSCPAATLKKLFSTLQVEVDDSIIQQALEVFSFGNMAKGSGGEKTGGSFYRKGITGDWKNHFSLTDMKYYRTKAGATMNRLGFRID